MSAERTLVLVKPDGVQRGLAGEIVSRLERTGLQIIGMKLMLISEVLAGRPYAEHSEKPFYSGLVSFITSSPVVALALKCPSAISTTRKIMGVTNPVDAAPGTIRGDLGVDMGRNLIHGSANAEDAAREVALFFDDSELVEYDRAIQPWLVE
ncbi:MAG TPA: nucleoside-diphosphate kinase [Dehalococcoidia bacterium]|nr:nucleoside-diphosphate kinase [Dehalococcoidia bacterium]